MLWTDLGGDGQWLERGLAQYELERPEIRGSSCRRPGGGTDSLAAGEVERNEWRKRQIYEGPDWARSRQKRPCLLARRGAAAELRLALSQWQHTLTSRV